ncbi:TetR/AcrR family transcriptional regulator [Siphonobacter aquaeclarae]|uniref:Transcriptional regulator, TetR family n=1 Tax=Siphonobacter aquaeclarae TaxID=563176 RepID=A0A1G9HYR7_9BACT|nr:TetR/AcrR family transcriptional regulator [Siphonobacter aquaeclarae]SDL18002.1 transcriptional regulator, TetR family [Siphonobacter aquaeclarae]
MGVAERKLRQREEVRTSILKASWDVVEKEGWQALSIRRIAEAIEYSIPVIYTHFENKEAILLEFTREGYLQLSQQMKAAKTLSDDSRRQLQDMAEAYWAFAFSHREHYQVMFGLGMPACDLVNRVEEIKLFSNVLLSVLEKAIAGSSQPGQDVFLKFHSYWSILHGLVSIKMMSPTEGHVSSSLVLQDAIGGFIRNFD